MMKIEVFKMKSVCIFLSGFMFFLSCSLNTYRAEAPVEESEIIEESSLFEKEEDDSAAGTQTGGTEWTSIYNFKTNDTKYLGTQGSGSTLWMIFGQDEEDGGSSVDFKDFTVEVTKSSGNAAAGYGIVFCQSNDETNGHCLLSLLININGYYCIGKMTDGVFEKLKDWTFCSSLYTGYISNLISVKKTDSTKYEIYFNGCKSAEFFDSAPVLKSGGRGLVAVISPKEKFPEVSVDLTWKIKN